MIINDMFKQLAIVKSYKNAKKISDAWCSKFDWEPNFIKKFDKWDNANFHIIDKCVFFSVTKPIFILYLEYVMKPEIFLFYDRSLNVTSILVLIILCFYAIPIFIFRVFHWKNLIVRNSPIDYKATATAVASKLPVVKAGLIGVAAVAGGMLAVNGVYKEAFPGATTPITGAGDWLRSKGLGPR